MSRDQKRARWFGVLYMTKTFLPILLDQLPHALGIPISVETVSLLVFIVTGALICFLLIVEPQGFARLWSTGKEKLRLWPYPY